jgi:hypothetical protein
VQKHPIYRQAAPENIGRRRRRALQATGPNTRRRATERQPPRRVPGNAGKSVRGADVAGDNEKRSVRGPGRGADEMTKGWTDEPVHPSMRVA